MFKTITSGVSISIINPRRVILFALTTMMTYGCMPPTIAPPTAVTELQCKTNELGTIPDGGIVRAYLNANEASLSLCQSETRICSKGQLSGSFKYLDCIEMVPNGPCPVPYGGLINHGESITAFQNASVPHGSSCSAQVRTCSHGVLSGSFENQSCSVASASSCSHPNGGTITTGQSITTYQFANVPFGSSCVSQSRTCTNGTLSGTYQYQNCTVTAASNCTLPYGGVLNHASSVTTYQTATVPFGSSCVSQSRTCTNGVLSGTYQYQACTVDDEINEDNIPRSLTKDSIPVAIAHPRTYLGPLELPVRINMCYGDNGIAECKNYFNSEIVTKVATAIANNQTLGLEDVIAYKAGISGASKDRALAAVRKMFDQRLGSSPGTYGDNELLAIDIMWPDLVRSDKLNFLETINKTSLFGYNSHIVNRNKEFGYHSTYTAHGQLAAALIIWDDPILMDPVVLSNTNIYKRWEPEDFIYVAHKEQSPGGHLTDLENYLAGDMTYNTALPGTHGGLYDNFGYDNSEEACSALMSALMKNATGIDYHLHNLRDKNKGLFWQVLRVPRSGLQVTLWNTQTSSYVKEMSFADVLTKMYKDPRLKYFAESNLNQSYVPPNRKLDAILHHDFEDIISSQGPEDLPLATYFSGGGIVASRDNWTNSTPFGVFISGEHISRRYTDINSFILHRKTQITGVTGARYRNSSINESNHFYAKLSIAKNTLKVCDPNESVDFSNARVPIAEGTGKKIHPDNNFCGQITEHALKAIDGTETSNRPEFNVPNYLNSGDITHFEHVPGLYTYALGDGKPAYTNKVLQFDRSYVHLHPNIFVIFDKVLTSNPNFKTSVLIHTWDDLNADRAPDVTGEGLKQWEDQNELIFNNGVDKVSFQTLLPKEKTSKVRGGTTYLLKNAVLPANSATAVNYNFTTRRYLEISAYDPANLTTLKDTIITITGDSETADNDSETVTFTGNDKERFIVHRTTQGTRATDRLRSADPEVWTVDMWKDWVAKKGSSEYTVIESNTADTLFADFSGPSYYEYQIIKYHANTTKKWKRIQSISSNKSLHGLDLGFSAFFDSENAFGDVYTFMPNTDAKADTYRRTTYPSKNYSVGTHTLEVFDDAVSTRHNFLNILKMGDPQDAISQSVLLEGVDFTGALINDIQVLFAKNGLYTGAASTVPLTGDVASKTIIFDLERSTNYYVKIESNILYLSKISNGGILLQSSPQGVVVFEH